MTETSNVLPFKVVDRGVSLVLPLAPVPASRPRVTRWGTYYGKRYTAWADGARKAFLHIRSKWNLDIPLFPSAPVMAALEIVCHKPKTGKRQVPIGDIDNFEKAVYDAATRSKLIWKDDDQINLVATAKRYARPSEEPHSRLWVAEAPASWIECPDDVYRLADALRCPYDDARMY